MVYELQGRSADMAFQTFDQEEGTGIILNTLRLFSPFNSPSWKLSESTRVPGSPLNLEGVM